MEMWITPLIHILLDCKGFIVEVGFASSDIDPYITVAETPQVGN